MNAPVRTHIPNLLFAAFMAGAFCALSREVYGGDGQMLTIDHLVMSLFLPAVIYLCGFGAVHIVMNMLQRGWRWAYVVAGAAALLLAFYCSAAQQILPTARQSGVVTVILMLPILFGAMLGYLYHRRAGPALAGDDPAAVAAALGASGGADAAYLKTGSDEYFDGPLQVRTSAPVLVLAGVGAGLAWAIISFALISLLMLGSMGPVEVGKAWTNGFLAFAAPYGVAAVAIGAVLMPIPVAIGHFVCRALHWTSYLAYAGTGLVIGIVLSLCGLMMVGMVIAIPCAFGLAFYRYLAGLEPLKLPEDIEVRDRRTLVGQDHPRRRYGRVIGS